MSLVIKLPKTSKGSEPRRKSIKRTTSPVDDETALASAPPPKRPRIQRSPYGSDEEEDPDSWQPARMPPASTSRPKPAKKRTKVVLSDPESEEFDPVDGSEDELPVDDDDENEYMSPKDSLKRAGKGKAGQGARGRKKQDSKEIMARDERKRSVDVSESSAAPPAKRPRTKLSQSGGEIVVDVVGDVPAASDTSPAKEDLAPAPPKKTKLPPIKKNKPPTTASSGPVAASIPSKTAPLTATRADEDSKLPSLTVGSRKSTLPTSVDVDLSNPMMYAQLFKSGGGSTPSGFTRREKDEERRKELNKMRDEARTKRIHDAAPVFDLQGQMEKISRFEERLRSRESPALYPNYLAGAFKRPAKKSAGDGNDLGPVEVREEGEM